MAEGRRDRERGGMVRFLLPWYAYFSSDNTNVMLEIILVLIRCSSWRLEPLDTLDRVYRHLWWRDARAVT